MKVLRATTCHPSADWIHQETRKDMPGISLGTVYRNLRLLKERGEILELDYDSHSRFDAQHHNHYHFKCAQCGNIFDVDLPVHKELDRQAADKTGFIVLEHRLQFHGICQGCQG